MKEDNLRLEAYNFGRYLLKKAPHDEAVELYIMAVGARPSNVSSADRRLLAFLQNHAWATGLIDAGLSVVNRNSDVRRRTHLMFSILESMPEYHEQFLSARHNLWYIFVIGYTGFVGLLKAAIGCVLVKAIGK